MTPVIWKQCVANWKTTLKQLKKKGAEVRKLRILAPPPAIQISEFEQSTGLTLPPDFKALLAISGGVNFRWWLLKKGTDDDFLKPPIPFAESGGNSECDFIGASKKKTLLELYSEFQQSYGDFAAVGASMPDWEDQSEIIRNCFPLYLTDLGGSALALRLDTEPAEVHFLEQEYGWHIFEKPTPSDRSLVGVGLTNFLVQWSTVGAPAPDYMLDSLRVCGGDEFDPESDAAKTWLAWLADPKANRTGS